MAKTNTRIVDQIVARPGVVKKGNLDVTDTVKESLYVSV